MKSMYYIISTPELLHFPPKKNPYLENVLERFKKKFEKNSVVKSNSFTAVGQQIPNSNSGDLLLKVVSKV